MPVPVPRRDEDRDRPKIKLLEEITLDSSDRITVERRRVFDRDAAHEVIVVVMPGGCWADSRLIRRALELGEAYYGKVCVRKSAGGGLDVRFNHDDVPETKHLRPKVVEELEQIFNDIEERAVSAHAT